MVVFWGGFPPIPTLHQKNQGPCFSDSDPIFGPRNQQVTCRSKTTRGLCWANERVPNPSPLPESSQPSAPDKRWIPRRVVWTLAFFCFLFRKESIWFTSQTNPGHHRGNQESPLPPKTTGLHHLRGNKHKRVVNSRHVFTPKQWYTKLTRP